MRELLSSYPVLETQPGYSIQVEQQNSWFRVRRRRGLAKMPPSQRVLQRLLHPRERTFWEFCDQAGDKVIENIILSCDDPGDMFAIIVGIKRFAVKTSGNCLPISNNHLLMTSSLSQVWSCRHCRWRLVIVC